MMANSELRTGNIILIDVIRYSPRTDDQQSQIITILNKLVNETPTMMNVAPEDRLSLPTGDGLATVFFRDPRSPIYFALELDEKLKERNALVSEEERFGLRMGINQGLVYIIKDINQRENLAGDGINKVQRVMDCGDAGHILVSQSFADSLARADSSLAILFHPLGEFEVKHGEKIAIASVYNAEQGNPEMPTRKPRVGGTMYDSAPAIRIMLVISRPLTAYCHEDSHGQLTIVNPSALLTDAKYKPLPNIDADTEIELLRRALQKAEAHIEISVSYGATLANIMETISGQNIRALHLDGYSNRHGALVLENPHGEAHLIVPELLAQIVDEHGIKLVTLRAPHVDECVEALREAGVPTVLGISDTARRDMAVAFISRFYRGLARGRPLDEAFERGKLMIKLLFGTDPGKDDTIIMAAEDDKVPLAQLPGHGSPPIFSLNSTKCKMIPEPDGQFIGRERKIVRIIKRLAEGNMVQIHGMDGIGKTALAQKIAKWHAQRGKFPGGIFWIDLKNGNTKEFIWDTIGADISGYNFRRLIMEEKASFLSNYFADRPSLIILDELDNVIKDGDLRKWLTDAQIYPSAILATTEQDIGVGEPEHLQELTPNEARRLFIEYARKKGWEEPIDDLEELIDEICQLVEYIPLPITLMASRANVYNLQTLKKEIELSLQEIDNSNEMFLPEKYRIINACLNASYKLLSSDEPRKLFRRLLTIAESADDELIKVTCGIRNWPAAVAELLRSSLLHRDGDNYRLSRLFRQYAAARLQIHGEEEEYLQRAEHVQRYYEQTQEIKEELGSMNKTATSLIRLSSRYESRGDFQTAIRLLTVAYDICAAIGSSNTARVKDDLQSYKGIVGEENFGNLMQKARANPNAVIREVLNNINLV